MGKNVYWESLKKWARKNPKLAGGSGVTLFGVLFAFLIASGSITVLDFDGDQYCAGDSYDSDPCNACVTFTANEDIFVGQTDYDPWGRNTPFDFDPAIKEWRMGRTWGAQMKWYNLTEPCRSSWCGWGSKSKDSKFAFAWREGKTYTVCAQALKNSPGDVIKWSALDGRIDPTWFGVKATKISFKKQQSCNQVFWNITRYFVGPVEHSFQCNTTNFNYTLSPKIAYCWDYYPDNNSLYYLFKGPFLKGNILSKKVWWNISERIGTEIVQKNRTDCQRTGKATVSVNKSGTLYSWSCDYSSWGECSLNKAEKRLECDSKYDGNADGKCDSGESCIFINMTGLKSILRKDSYRELDFDNYDVRCVRQ